MTKFKEYLRGVDLYGTPVGVNYRGEGQFKTKCGGFCTICNLISVFFYALTKFLQLEAGLLQDYSTLKLAVNLEESQPVNLVDNNLQIGLITSSSDKFVDFDPRFGAIIGMQISMDDYFKNLTITNASEASEDYCDRSLWSSDYGSLKLIEESKPKCFPKYMKVQGSRVSEKAEVVLMNFYTCS